MRDAACQEAQKLSALYDEFDVLFDLFQLQSLDLAQHTPLLLQTVNLVLDIVGLHRSRLEERQSAFVIVQSCVRVFGDVPAFRLQSTKLLARDLLVSPHHSWICLCLAGYCPKSNSMYTTSS